MNVTHAAVAAGLLFLLFGGELVSLFQSSDTTRSCLQHFPGLEVSGSSHPVPTAKALLAYLVFLVQLGVTCVVFAGDRMFAYLGVPPPAWYLEWKERQMAVLMATWFVGNMIRNSLTSTGAFEVFYDGHQVFSKLQTGRMPTLDELLQKIGAAVNNRTFS